MHYSTRRRSSAARRRSARALAVILALSAALFAACGNGDETRMAGTGDAMSDDDHGHAAMVEVDAADAPTVDLDVAKDMAAGWNLHAVVAGMTLMPEKAGLENLGGEGHMHLYVDGVKVGRVYTSWYHLGDLEPGTHEVKVTLNANSHADLAVDGVPIAATATIEQPEPSETHSHMDMTHEASAAMSVSLAVTPDPVKGWNAFIDTSGFAWAPEHASMEHVAGEGHAHLYVDGVKIARLYGNAYHFTYDQPGTHEVKVSLNGNDHGAYIWSGVPVEATAAITVEGVSVEADETVVVSVRDGEVVGPERVEVATGAVLQIDVESDVADSVHVHGYDAYADVAEGRPARVKLTADIPGVFEVELEGSGLMLFELVVR